MQSRNAVCGPKSGKMDALEAMNPHERTSYLEALKRPELQKVAKEAGLKVSLASVP